MAAETKHGKWMLMTGSVSALGAGLIFLAGIAALRVPGADHGLALLRGNWLITIFRLLTGDPGIQASQLFRLNALDLVLLGLIAATHAGLYCALHRSRRILAVIALVQPPLGILLFLLTQSVGRCAVMGAGLAMSAAMPGSQDFSKWTGWMGMIASMLLLAGDFGTGMAPSSILAVSTGIGYILLTCWLFVVSCRLFQLAR